MNREIAICSITYILATILVGWGIKMRQNADNKTSRSSNSTIWLTIFAFLISGIFLIILVYLNLDYTGDGIYYLLSSISQGLAATFAILFTLLILEAQIASKYSSYLIEAIFGKLTLGYMALFIIAIIMPLICLRHMNKLLLEFSFTFAVLCLTLIVPFLISVRDKFNPTNLINENCRLAVKAIKKRGFLNEPKKEVEYIFSKIRAIGGIARISMLEEDYSVYSDGVKALEEIEFKYIESKPDISNSVKEDYSKLVKETKYIPSWQDFFLNKKDELPELLFDVTLFKELFCLFDVAHFKSTTPYQSTTSIIKLFGKIGSKAIDANNHSLVKEVFGCLSEAGQRGSTVSRDWRIADRAFRELKAMIEKIIKVDTEKEKMEELIKIGCKDLFMLGIRCYYGPEITHYYKTPEWQGYSLGKGYCDFLAPLLETYHVVDFIIDFGKNHKLWTNIESCTYGYFGLDPPKRFREFEEYCLMDHIPKYKEQSVNVAEK